MKAQLLVDWKFKRADLSEARLQIRKSASSTMFGVVRYLPPGEDIGPDVWRYDTEQEADSMFHAQTAWLQNRGYNIAEMNGTPEYGRPLIP